MDYGRIEMTLSRNKLFNKYNNTHKHQKSEGINIWKSNLLIWCYWKSEITSSGKRNKGQKLRTLITTIIIRTFIENFLYIHVMTTHVWIFLRTRYPIYIQVSQNHLWLSKSFTNMFKCKGSCKILLTLTTFRNDCELEQKK